MPRRGIRLGWATGCGLCLTACVPAEKTGFDAPGPSKRLDAIVEASGDEAGPESLRRLVEQLDSQDAAARMLAIRALEKRTGTTLGYNHTDPEWARQEGVERWIKYLDSGGSEMDLPSSAGGRPGQNPMES